MTLRTEVDWTPEAVARFWDWISSNPIFEESYFSRIVGGGIVSFIREAGYLKGPALDFGCGRGDLVKQMHLAGITCGGADFSAKSLQQCEQVCGDSVLWLGGRVVDLKSGTGFANDTFALITCVEVVEHLPQAFLAQTFAELFRLLRPGGVLFLTTPFEESLRSNSIYCPFCDGEFHRWQHMRSISKNDLATWSEDVGLHPVFCENLDFRAMEGDVMPWMGWRSASYDTIRHCINWALLGMFDDLNRKPFPHGNRMKIRLRAGERNTLCLIAQKPIEGAINAQASE